MSATADAATRREAIVLAGVDKWFKTQDEPVHALAPTSLSVAAGEFVVLLGPSGCGKTTLLRIVGGLIQPSKGEVRVLDHELWANGTRQNDAAEGMGIVFQDANLFPWLTVEQNITLPLELKGAPKSSRRERARALISSSASAGSSSAGRASCRAACASARRSPARSPTIPRFC